MQIRIVAEGHHFTIPLPMGIFVNGITVQILSRCLSKYTDFHLTPKQLRILGKALKQSRKTLANLPLVDIQSSDGESVRITL